MATGALARLLCLPGVQLLLMRGAGRGLAACFASCWDCLHLFRLYAVQPATLMALYLGHAVNTHLETAPGFRSHFQSVTQGACCDFPHSTLHINHAQACQVPQQLWTTPTPPISQHQVRQTALQVVLMRRRPP